MQRTRTAIITAIALLTVYGFTDRMSGNGGPNIGTNIGDRAPELAYFNVDSTRVLKLSDLRGKYVLIDFWASWCGPCRRENPNVVQAYEKYSKAKFKDAKGFTIYSVSLDKNRESWRRAIEQDHLSWSDHVSDLKAWSSEAARLYGITGIPMNFLVDPDGVIVAKNLRGLALHQELDKRIKSL
ncbi:MAG: TlpA family protein disulfide reductase [Flavobacteriales bacterium]|nr:TlpA family protein disulfide reductase [Flavobacteriales bacterium]